MTLKDNKNKSITKSDTRTITIAVDPDNYVTSRTLNIVDTDSTKTKRQIQKPNKSRLMKKIITLENEINRLNNLDQTHNSQLKTVLMIVIMLGTLFAFAGISVNNRLNTMNINISNSFVVHYKLNSKISDILFRLFDIDSETIQTKTQIINILANQTNLKMDISSVNNTSHERYKVSLGVIDLKYQANINRIYHLHTKIYDNTKKIRETDLQMTYTNYLMADISNRMSDINHKIDNKTNHIVKNIVDMDYKYMTSLMFMKYNITARQDNDLAIINDLYTKILDIDRRIKEYQIESKQNQTITTHGLHYKIDSNIKLLIDMMAGVSKTITENKQILDKHMSIYKRRVPWPPVGRSGSWD